MNIEYRNTAEDLLHLNLYHFQQSPALRRKRFLFRFGFPIVLVIGIIILKLTANISILIMLPVGFVIVFWVAYMPRVLRSNVTKQVKKLYNKDLVKDTVCKHRLSLTPDGITDNTELKKIKTPWADVHKMVVTDRYLFIYIAEESAYIIPKTVFPNKSKCDEFIETAKQYTERARN